MPLDLFASWGALGFPVEDLMAVEPSAVRGFQPRPLRARVGAIRGDSGDMGVEWDECGLARVGNVALIQIEGPLARCGGWWYSGYDQILEAHDKAFRSDARALLQVHHSPGGVVSGGDEMAMALEKMAAAYPGKPLHALSSDMMYSMAMRIGLTTAKRYTTRAGGMGSIGITTSRYDWTKANEMMGVRVETLATGAYKTDGNPDVPVTKEELARIQERIDYHGALFFDATSRATGLSIEAVRGQKAALFLGPAAVNAKLADGVSTLQEAIQRLENQTSARASVAVPAGPARGQTTAAKGQRSMEISMLALALGLAGDAKDQEITARVQTLTGLESKLRETTGKADGAASFAVIEGWRDASGKLAEVQGELAKVQAREEQAAYQALVKTGEDNGQITPANKAGVLAKFGTSGQLSAYLSVAPRALPGHSGAGERPAAGEGKGDAAKGSALTYKGKAYKDLTYSERAAWKGENEEQWAEAKAEYTRQKGG